MSYNEESSRVERLLIKKQQNRISPEELAHLEQLLKENPALDFDISPAFQSDEAVNKIWLKLEKRLIRSKYRKLRWLAVIAVGCVVFFFRSTPPDLNIIQVPPQLDHTIILSDGSTIKLNSSTTLKYTTDKREVYINGEAWFKIISKADLPFIVHTDKGDITVLGTEFNVNTYTKGVLKTALIKGAVNVNSNHQVIRLKPGEELISSGGKNLIKTLDEQVTLSWMDGVIYFHNTPLSEIGAMIERWYAVLVVIDDDQLAAELFTGKMEKRQPLGDFLTPLKGVVKMHCYYEGNVLHMIR